MSSVENQKPLPSEKKILKWLETEEASQTYKALRALDLLHHARSDALNLSEYFNLPLEIKKLSLRQQKRWLLNQLPIKDTRHALYIPKDGRLILSTQSQAWKHLNDTILTNISDHLETDKLVCGIGTEIKSSGQKIFVPDHISSASAGLTPNMISEKSLNDFLLKNPGFVPALKISIDGLEKKGYVILIPDYDKNGRYREESSFTLLANAL